MFFTLCCLTLNTIHKQGIYFKIIPLTRFKYSFFQSSWIYYEVLQRNLQALLCLILTLLTNTVFTAKEFLYLILNSPFFWCLWRHNTIAKILLLGKNLLIVLIADHPIHTKNMFFINTKLVFVECILTAKFFN